MFSKQKRERDETLEKRKNEGRTKRNMREDNIVSWMEKTQKTPPTRFAFQKKKITHILFSRKNRERDIGKREKKRRKNKKKGMDTIVWACAPGWPAW